MSSSQIHPHILLNLQKTKDKEKRNEPKVWGMKGVKYGGTRIIITVDFS